RGFWGPNGAGKGPLLCGITGGRRGIPAKKAADAALRGIASAAFCMVVLFWVAFGKVRVCAVLPARPENEAPGISAPLPRLPDGIQRRGMAEGIGAVVGGVQRPVPQGGAAEPGAVLHRGKQRTVPAVLLAVVGFARKRPV